MKYLPLESNVKVADDVFGNKADEVRGQHGVIQSINYVGEVLHYGVKLNNNDNFHWLPASVINKI
jgi:hypothetical protein